MIYVRYLMKFCAPTLGRYNCFFMWLCMPNVSFLYLILFPFHLEETRLWIVVSFDTTAKMLSHLYKIKSSGKKKSSAKTQIFGTMNIKSQFWAQSWAICNHMLYCHCWLLHWGPSPSIVVLCTLLVLPGFLCLSPSSSRESRWKLYTVLVCCHHPHI
jgi:hypothetical protein